MDRWAEIRALGRRRYIWLHGVLRWGGFMFVFSLVVFNHALSGAPHGDERAVGNAWLRAGVALTTWVWVGYLYGRSSWNRNERAYASWQAAQRTGDGNLKA